MAEQSKSDSPPPSKSTEQASQQPSEGVVFGERGKALGAKPLMMQGEVPGMPDIAPAPTNVAPSEGTSGSSTSSNEGSGSSGGSSSSE
jgi:hypothetical protein